MSTGTNERDKPKTRTEHRGDDGSRGARSFLVCFVVGMLMLVAPKIGFLNGYFEGVACHRNKLNITQCIIKNPGLSRSGIALGWQHAQKR